LRPLVVASLPVSGKDDLRLVSEIEADLVELRLDYMKTLDVTPMELANLKEKVIVTIRDPEEGGIHDVDCSAKAEFLRELASLGVLYDVEARFLHKFQVPYVGKIVSAHYFTRLPSREEVDNMFRRYREALSVKVAVSPIPGYRELLAYLSLKDNATIMPMVDNPLERVAFTLLGSKMVYGYVKEPTAKGQLHYSTLVRILDFLFNLR
jgi:3-dehydroquinate dehydratase